jgi:hypothetical protein
VGNDGCRGMIRVNDSGWIAFFVTVPEVVFAFWHFRACKVGISMIAFVRCWPRRAALPPLAMS